MRERGDPFDIILTMSQASEDRPGVVAAPSSGVGRKETVARSGLALLPDGPWKATESICDLPAWVGRLLGNGTCDSSIACRHRSIRVEQAALMSPAEFEAETRNAYRKILEGLDVDRLWRAWNFIPRINDDASDGGIARDRYMAFNAGRHHGFADVHGAKAHYPVASGVGHESKDLVIHLLHGDESPRVVNNPRQIKPDDYSHRYGYPPPAFARACLLDLGDTEGLLVSGTASVVGEASLHDDDFTAQLDETLRNLQTIVQRAWPGQDLDAIDDWLVYLPDPRHAEQVREAISSSAPGLETTIAIREQPLCRPELLVEIECAAFQESMGDSR